MLYSPQAQRLDSNCPSPTTAPRRRLHREYQTFLHHLLLETFQDLCPAVTANHTSTAKYDDAAFQDADGYPYCVGTELLKALHHYYVPTDDQTSMNVQQTFEKQIKSFPGIPSSASVEAFEKWANDIADKWNKLAPYDQFMNNTQPRYIQMLFQQLQTRQMMKIDGIEWREFSNHLHKQPEWSNMKDIPTFLSLLIAWAHTQLTALTDAEGTLAHKPWSGEESTEPKQVYSGC